MPWRRRGEIWNVNFPNPLNSTGAPVPRSASRSITPTTGFHPARLARKDQPMFQAAMACRADYLLTGETEHETDSEEINAIVEYALGYHQCVGSTARGRIYQSCASFNIARISSVDSLALLSAPSSRLSARSRLCLWSSTFLSSMVAVVTKR